MYTYRYTDVLYNLHVITRKSCVICVIIMIIRGGRKVCRRLLKKHAVKTVSFEIGTCIQIEVFWTFWARTAQEMNCSVFANMCYFCCVYRIGFSINVISLWNAAGGTILFLLSAVADMCYQWFITHDAMMEIFKLGRSVRPLNRVVSHFFMLMKHRPYNTRR